MYQKVNPPKLAERFFQWFCHRAHLEGLEGDLYEMFDRNVKDKGPTQARLLYLLDIVTLMRSTVAGPANQNSKWKRMDMYKNYVRNALRMGWKRKGFSSINLVGLILGITSVLFISLYIMDELRFDKHIADHEQKYRVYNIYHSSSGSTKKLAIVPPMYATEFKSNFPQVKKAGRLMLDYGGTMFRVGDKILSEENGYFAEEEALEILDIDLIHGSLENLEESNTVLLSETTFRRFFGEDPYNAQTVLIGSKTSIKIAGVYRDFPEQTHIRPDYFISFNYLLKDVSDERIHSWIWQQFYTYVEFSPGTAHDATFDELSKYVEDTAWPVTAEYNMHYEPVFQPLTDIHLHSENMEWDEANRSSYQAVFFLFIAAGIILFIACLNFINLTTAQALKRAREVVVRKFIGANRSQLITQYIIESLVYTLISGVVSAIVVMLLLPFFNQFAGKNFLFGEIFRLSHIVIYGCFLCVLGIVSGIYPALLLTSFKPLNVLHGTPALGTKAGFKIELRQLMVGAQYLVTIGLVLISLIMQKQYNHLRHSDMGFNKENLLAFPISRSMRNDIEQTRNRFAGHNNILGVSACFGVPGGIVAGDAILVPDLDNQAQSVSAFMVDENYIPVMDIQLIAGRNFDPDVRSDEFRSFIINETAVKNFGFGTPEEAIGKRLNWEMWDDGDTLKRGQVIGVVADFNYKSLHNAVENVVLQIDRTEFSYLMVKVGAGDLNNTLEFLEGVYREQQPNRLFEFEFIDQSFQKFYESEERLSQMFTVFTLLAIFTAAIGLFGLVTYSVVSRGKEIGIRKVLGAGITSIFVLLVRRYFVLMGLSLAVALPVAYYIVLGWLQGFAYRIAIEPGVFILVVVLTVLLTMVTVGYQALRGAMVNPSEKLRSE